jgi:hypothetical protein
VIREPKGAILSQVVREPDVALGNAMVAYARFHACLMPYQSCFVVADFEEITHDFGSVIQRMNESFGTSFDVFRHTEASEKECFDLIKHRPTTIEPWRASLLGFESGTVTIEQLRKDQEKFGSQSAGAASTWIPSSERSLQKEELERAWLDPKLSKRRARAEASYALLGGANTRQTLRLA